MQWSAIEQAIAQVESCDFKVQQSRSIGGGSINSAYLLTGKDQQFFVKTNSAKYADMFFAEAEGLAELHKTDVIKVPRPICWGAHGTSAFIVLEYIEMGRARENSHAQLGQQLAALHSVTEPRFGWYRDNTIGSTPQVNAYNNEWIDFYRQQRLEYQISLAVNHGASSELRELGSQLCENLEVFFASYSPQASLLHGDLWSGNYDFDVQGDPVIFDPAVYYGDREADLAMTELFGGFTSSFYQAYNETYPLDAGYAVRKDLYNLYHALNHFNLFGGGYQQQAIAMMHRLMAEIR